MSSEMDSLEEMCRGCLSPNTIISILDNTDNIKQKFLEATTIEVKKEDKLPQKLCNNCLDIVNTSYEFRNQCKKMDKELRDQLKALLEMPSKLSADKENIENYANDKCMKKLESLIKSEPMDEDDCYIIVIDEKENNSQIPPELIKAEVINDEYQEVPFEDDSQHSLDSTKYTVQSDIESCIDSFLLSNNKIPTSVPDTILENEEGHENEIGFINNIETTPDGNNTLIVEDSLGIQKPLKVTLTDGMKDFSPKNLIKIVTPSGVEKTVLLENDEGINYMTDNQESNDNEDTQEEVIYCEGDENSQYQILKVDGSEFIIEYADEAQIATVLQQEDGTFLCDCGEQFEDILEFQKHQYKHNPANEHLCSMCGKGFESAEILTGHTLLHRSTGPLVSCPFCDQLIRRNSLTQHIKYTHNAKPKCDICEKTFANQNNLKRHMMIHSGIKEFECDICYKRFNQKITMQTHRLTHINSTTCNLCDRIFEDKAALTHHKESNECPKTKDDSAKEQIIRSIRQTVTTNLGKVLGYACSLCKKMFSLESALVHHIESTHIIEETDDKKASRLSKRFECSMCGKRCASQAMLVMHERVHTNERPFPCQLCSLKFKTKTHLRTHQLTHTREKKFGCSVCMKFFALKGNLVVHLRTHTGERPYVCTLCGDAFIDSKYLKKHKLRKHAIDNNLPWDKF